MYAQIRTRLRKYDAQNSLGLEDTNGSLNLDHKIILSVNKKKKKKAKNKVTCQLVDFAVPANPKVKKKKKKKRKRKRKYRQIPGFCQRANKKAM